MARSSFGLRPENKSYIYEEIFTLVRHCNISYTEAWDMPIPVRHWWIQRVNKEESEKNGNKQQSTAMSPIPWAGKQAK